MKMMILSVMIGVGCLAQAAATDDKGWSCSADGYDHQYEMQTVYGLVKDTQQEAEQSALMSCQIEGLRSCSIVSCSDQNF